MSENQEVITPAQQEEVRETVVPQTNPFTGSWTETLPEVKQEVKAEEVKPPEVVAPATAPEEKVFDESVYLKENYGFETPEALKQRLKEQAPQEWANEDSKNIYELIRQGKTKEVREYLEKQDALSTYTSVDVNDDTAGEIIKLGMKLRFPDLTQKEIDYKYSKQFSVPREPVQRDDETDDEYAMKKSQWQETVEDIKMNKIIEAKLAKPELEKLKSNIVLPQLEKPQATKQEPDQKLLEAQKVWADNFLSTLESNYNKVEGFTTEVKDESVTIPVSFKIQDTDKVALKGRFAEGFDLNGYFDKRWFDGKELPKTEQMMSDIYILENLDKILSGVANNAANQRLEEYKKSIKNVNLNGTRQNTYQPTQSSTSTVNPFAQGAWSESLPIPNS